VSLPGRFAGVLASDEEGSDLLELAEVEASTRGLPALEGRRTILEKLDEERRSYEQQLARSGNSILPSQYAQSMLYPGLVPTPRATHT